MPTVTINLTFDLSEEINDTIIDLLGYEANNDDNDVIDLSVSGNAKPNKNKCIKTANKRQVKRKASLISAQVEKKKKRECSVCYRTITKNNFWNVCQTALDAEVTHDVCKYCIKKIMKQQYWKHCCPLCRSPLLTSEIDKKISLERDERRRKKQARQAKKQQLK